MCLQHKMICVKIIKKTYNANNERFKIALKMYKFSVKHKHIHLPLTFEISKSRCCSITQQTKVEREKGHAAKEQQKDKGQRASCDKLQEVIKKAEDERGRQ